MSLLKMTFDIAQAQIRQRNIDANSLSDCLRVTHGTLLDLYLRENGEPKEEPSAPVRWQDSIKQKLVVCLECGKSYRQLTQNHLQKHGLTTAQYRLKYKIPPSQSLSAKAVTMRRRQSMRAIAPWGKAIAARQANRDKKKG